LYFLYSPLGGVKSSGI